MTHFTNLSIINRDFSMINSNCKMFAVYVLLITLSTSRFVEALATKEQKSLPVHPDTGLNFTELVEKHGYPVETHKVQTEDGYILSLFRIPNAQNNRNDSQTANPPVLLMAGLLNGPANYLTLGPDRALGYLLADAGYDVWFGNPRGTTPSREHITLDPDVDEKAFFNFSFHEIGIYDLPTNIDYILDKTQQPDLFYVGHSQGTTEFFIMAAEKPVYNDKVRLMTGLAPVAYLNQTRSDLFIFFAKNHLLIDAITDALHMYELLAYNEILFEFSVLFCTASIKLQNICIGILYFIGGLDLEKFDGALVTVIASNDPVGSSIKQSRHYAQWINSGRFCKYDYGAADNLEYYGTEDPPDYDIQQITVPISLFYSKNDNVSTTQDVERFAPQLPNLVSAEIVADDQFSHLDFLWSKDIVSLVNSKILEHFKQFTSKHV